MPKRSTTQSNNTLKAINDYLTQQQKLYLLSDTDSFSKLSTELFKELLFGMKLKEFKACNLTEVDFQRIDREAKEKGNTHVFTDLDFSGANFQNSNLSGLNFFRSNFTGAYLGNADLHQINLAGSDLVRVNASGADISQANLAETNWESAYLKDINLSESLLMSANFEDANLQGAKLNNANLKETQWMDANLFGVNLVEANLENADLSRANLAHSALYDTNLRNANLRGACFDEAQVLRTKVSGANLEATLIEHINYNHYLGGSFYDWSIMGQASREKYPNRTPAVNLPDEEEALSLLARCLPIQSIADSDCQITWADIYSMSLNKDFTCDINEIVLNSELFIQILQSKNEAQQKQWLKVAQGVKISGNAGDRLKQLIQYEKLGALWPEYKKYIIDVLEQSKNASTTGPTLSSANTTTLLLNTPTELASLWGDEEHLFNATVFDINTIVSVPNPNSSSEYDLTIDLLSPEVRQLLKKIQSFSMYKQPAAKTIFIPHSKSNMALERQQTKRINYLLDMEQYPEIKAAYPEVFQDCEEDCFNVTLSDSTLIRWLLTKLTKPYYLKSPLINLTQNLTVLPYQSVLKFENTEFRIDEKAQVVGYVSSNQSIATIIQAYVDLAYRLKLSFSIIKPITNEMIVINPAQSALMHNHLQYPCHFIGGENILISGSDRLNLTQFPLPRVTLHRSDINQVEQLDFRLLTQEIKENFNADLLLKLKPHQDNLSINCYFQQLDSQGIEQSIPVISVILRNALKEHWYKQLEIITHAEPSKIVNHGLKNQLEPLPYRVLATNNVDFLRLEKLEKKSRILISAPMEHISFLRIQNALVLTDALTSFAKGKKLYFLVIPDFYEDLKKSMTHQLEFTDVKIRLSDHRLAISNATEAWDDLFNQHKKDLLTSVYQSVAPGLLFGYSDNVCALEYLYFFNDERYRRSADKDLSPPVTNQATRAHTGILQTTVDIIKKVTYWLLSDVSSKKAWINEAESKKKISHQLQVSHVSQAESIKLVVYSEQQTPRGLGICHRHLFYFDKCTKKQFPLGKLIFCDSEKAQLVLFERTEDEHFHTIFNFYEKKTGTSQRSLLTMPNQSLILQRANGAKQQEKLVEYWQYRIAVAQFKQRAQEIGIVYLSEQCLLYTTMGDYFRALGLTPNWQQRDVSYFIRRIVSTLPSSNRFQSHVGAIHALFLETALLHPRVQAMLPSEGIYQSKLVLRFIADLVQWGFSASLCVPFLIEFSAHPWSYEIAYGLRAILAMLEITNNPSTWYLVVGLFILPLTFWLENLGIPVTHYVSHILEGLERLMNSCDLLPSVEADPQRLERKEVAKQEAHQRVCRGRERVSHITSSMLSLFFKRAPVNDANLSDLLQEEHTEEFTARP